MQVFTTVDQLSFHLEKKRKKGRSTAFVPTLGALHHGHLTLMTYARSLADIVVASIFVNPTQFNDPKDLEKYPRPWGHDIHLLCTTMVDILFLPPEHEIYPAGYKIEVPVNISRFTNVMEGLKRPGHFEGVVTVVKRLLDIVQPDYLIMGQKDYQQQVIIGSMIRQLKRQTQLSIHPTLRDQDGLALSSRNARIDPALRPVANTLFMALKKAVELQPICSPSEVEKICSGIIRDQGFHIEYFTLADGLTLQPVSDWNQHDTIVACVAAWLGDVRLIDNVIVKPPTAF